MKYFLLILLLSFSVMADIDENGLILENSVIKASDINTNLLKIEEELNNTNSV